MQLDGKCISDAVYIIMYNNSASIIKERKLFTLAHELGHILSGHFDIISYNQLAQNNTSDKILEREANYFASCLLSPIPIVCKIEPKSILEIQDFFKISYESAEITWKDYKNYNRNFNIPWHNDMIKLYKHCLPSRI